MAGHISSHHGGWWAVSHGGWGGIWRRGGVTGSGNCAGARRRCLRRRREDCRGEVEGRGVDVDVDVDVEGREKQRGGGGVVEWSEWSGVVDWRWTGSSQGPLPCGGCELSNHASRLLTRPSPTAGQAGLPGCSTRYSGAALPPSAILPPRKGNPVPVRLIQLGILVSRSQSHQPRSPIHSSESPAAIPKKNLYTYIYMQPTQPKIERNRKKKNSRKSNLPPPPRARLLHRVIVATKRSSPLLLADPHPR